MGSDFPRQTQILWDAVTRIASIAEDGSEVAKLAHDAMADVLRPGAALDASAAVWVPSWQAAKANDDVYPVPVPTWAPSEGFPQLSDKDALDYLAGTVLGDQDSNNAYVVGAAMLTVLRTYRQITTYGGD